MKKQPKRQFKFFSRGELIFFGLLSIASSMSVAATIPVGVKLAMAIGISSLQVIGALLGYKAAKLAVSEFFNVVKSGYYASQKSARKYSKKHGIADKLNTLLRGKLLARKLQSFINNAPVRPRLVIPRTPVSAQPQPSNSNGVASLSPIEGKGDSAGLSSLPPTKEKGDSPGLTSLSSVKGNSDELAPTSPVKGDNVSTPNATPTPEQEAVSTPPLSKSKRRRSRKARAKKLQQATLLNAGSVQADATDDQAATPKQPDTTGDGFVTALTKENDDRLITLGKIDTQIKKSPEKTHVTFQSPAATKKAHQSIITRDEQLAHPGGAVRSPVKNSLQSPAGSGSSKSSGPILTSVGVEQPAQSVSPAKSPGKTVIKPTTSKAAPGTPPMAKGNKVNNSSTVASPLKANGSSPKVFANKATEQLPNRLQQSSPSIPVAAEFLVEQVGSVSPKGNKSKDKIADRPPTPHNKATTNFTDLSNRGEDNDVDLVASINACLNTDQLNGSSLNMDEFDESASWARITTGQLVDQLSPEQMPAVVNEDYVQQQPARGKSPNAKIPEITSHLPRQESIKELASFFNSLPPLEVVDDRQSQRFIATAAVLDEDTSMEIEPAYEVSGSSDSEEKAQSPDTSSATGEMQTSATVANGPSPHKRVSSEANQAQQNEAAESISPAVLFKSPLPPSESMSSASQATAELGTSNKIRRRKKDEAELLKQWQLKEKRKENKGESADDNDNEVDEIENDTTSPQELRALNLNKPKVFNTPTVEGYLTRSLTPASDSKVVLTSRATARAVGSTSKMVSLTPKVRSSTSKIGSSTSRTGILTSRAGSSASRTGTSTSRATSSTSKAGSTSKGVSSTSKVVPTEFTLSASPSEKSSEQSISKTSPQADKPILSATSIGAAAKKVSTTTTTGEKGTAARTTAFSNVSRTTIVTAFNASKQQKPSAGKPEPKARKAETPKQSQRSKKA